MSFMSLPEIYADDSKDSGLETYSKNNNKIK